MFYALEFRVSLGRALLAPSYKALENHKTLERPLGADQEFAAKLASVDACAAPSLALAIDHVALATGTLPVDDRKRSELSLMVCHALCVRLFA